MKCHLVIERLASGGYWWRLSDGQRAVAYGITRTRWGARRAARCAARLDPQAQSPRVEWWQPAYVIEEVSA